MSDTMENSGEGLVTEEISWILKKVPRSLDMGTVLVDIRCIDVSQSWIVMGASCGAVFVYNVRAATVGRPIRSTGNEPSCLLRLFESPTWSAVAIGHERGTVAVVELRGEGEGAGGAGRKPFLRSDSDSHRGARITSLEWSGRGQGARLLSGSGDGVVIMTHVDAEQSLFSPTFVFCGGAPICQMALRGHHLLILTDCVVRVNVATAEEERVCGSDDLVACCWTESGAVLTVSATGSVRRVEEGEGGGAASLMKGGGGAVLSRARLCSGRLSLISSTGRVSGWEMGGEEWQRRGDFEAGKLDKWIHDACLSSDGSLFVLMPRRRMFRVGSALWGHAPSEKEEGQGGLFGGWGKGTGLARYSEMLSHLGGQIGAVATTVAEDSRRQLEALKPELRGLAEQVVASAERVAESTDHVQVSCGVPIYCDTETSEAADLIEEHVPVDEPVAIAVARRQKTRGAGRRPMGGAERGGAREEDGMERLETPPMSIDEGKLTALREIVAHGSSPLSPRKLEMEEREGGRETDEREVLPEKQEGSATDSSDSEEEQEKEKEQEKEFIGAAVVEKEKEEQEKPADESTNESLESVLKRRAKQVVALQPAPSPPSSSFSSASRKWSVSKREESASRAVVLNDRVDIWSRFDLPFTPSSICLSGNSLIMCHRKRKPKTAKLDSLVCRKTPWESYKWDADQIAVNEDGSLAWRLYKGKVSMSVDCSAHSVPAPCSDWLDVEAGRVAEMAIGGRDGWMIGDRVVEVRMDLPEKGIAASAECDWPLKGMAVGGGGGRAEGVWAVWAIHSVSSRLVCRVGLNKCRMGLDWIEYQGLDCPSEILAVALCAGTGWCLDSGGTLWFSNGVDANHPFGTQFLKVCSPLSLFPLPRKPAIPPSQWRIAVSHSAVALTIARNLFIARSPVSGHRFPHSMPQRLELLDNWTALSAGGFAEREEDGIFLCRPNSELFLFRPDRGNVITHAMPKGEDGRAVMAVHLVSSPSRLCLLDSAGHVWWTEGERVRRGDPPHWRLHAIAASCVSIALSCVSLWVVSAEGIISMLDIRENRDGESPSSSVPECDGWRSVAPPKEGGRMEQVFCSRDGRYVWVSGGGRQWARKGVDGKRRREGDGWTEANSSVACQSLAVGSNVVWALDESGALFRLRGLAAGNPAGNYWREVATGFRSISVDACNGLWALDTSNKLVRHSTDIYPSKVHRMPRNEIKEEYEII